MKIEINLSEYNKLRIKEEILNQIKDLSVPSGVDYNELKSTYYKIENILSANNDVVIMEYNSSLNLTTTMSKKVYDYYLIIQMVFSQIENLTCSSLNSATYIVDYLNTVYIYLKTYKKELKNRDAEIEEFNTLVKLEQENRILRKKNIELENKLKEEDSIDF